MNINEVQKEGISNIFSENRSMYTDGKAKLESTGAEKVFGAYYSANDEAKTGDITYDKYQGIAEENLVKETFSEADVHNMINTLNENVTAESYSQMETLGLAPKEDDMGTIVTVNERIQIQLAAYCDDYEGTALSVSSGEVKDVLGAAAAGNGAAIDKALNMALNVKSYSEEGRIPENAKAYLLGNSLVPSIENTYKAVHSGAVTGKSNNNDIINDSQWESMKSQVAGIYEGAGYEASEANLAEGRWMVENGIALNEENIALSKQIDATNFDMSDAEMTKFISDSSVAGILPEATVFNEKGSMIEIAEDLVNTVNSVTTDDLNYIVTNNNELTFDALKEAREAVTKMDAYAISKMRAEVSAEAYGFKYTVAGRVVFEAQLLMTTGSMVQMMKLGVNVDVMSLSDTVDKLKELEGELYKSYFTEAGVVATEENVSLMQQTLFSASYVKYELSHNENDFVGRTYSTESKTLSNLTLMQAEATYAGVGTEVRRNLGDDIKKAFDNADTLLESLGIEVNDANLKAARILGYNSMEINEDNVTAVKNLSLQLELLTKNLTPQTVVNLIKDGINPLNVEISRLNEQLEIINDTYGNKNNDEKYSKFLWKLDKVNALTDDERAAYIGMYRLIKWAGKNDGDVLGSLYKQGSEVNLKNLLMAARTKKVKGIDEVLDDKFGVIQQVTKLDDIEKDINKVMTDPDIVEYTENLLKSAKEVATPEGFADILSETNPGSNTPEQLYDKLMAAEDVYEEAYVREQAESMKQAGLVSEETIKTILDSNMTLSVNNLLAAGMLYQDTKASYERIKRFSDTDRIEEALKSGSEENLKNAIEAVADEVQKKNDELKEEAATTYELYREAVFAGNLMTVMSKMSQSRHYVVESTINEKSTIINLSVGTGSNNTVGVSYRNETYGEITAELRIVENSLYGKIGAENNEALRLLQEKLSELVKAFEDMGFDNVQIDISVVSIEINTVSGQSGSMDNNDDLRLFETAKTVISWI